ncbi:hypothetical protein L1I30_11635 [Gillisia sp. M10.2A]|uniref:Outer membrane protein beta-barrel domain-containing protein n=1 Tax=Gillisia lutea TaxID=2909668 RepID=A0ABS9EJ08_9FLAO|nr:DUF6588 family protein [Gillisia lutea]MCF4102322.1 hypothetical protein [Gillisia lutea]
MKKTAKYLLAIASLCAFNSLKAQSDKEQIISDMLIIADNFVAPGAEGAAVQSSAGWFSSGKAMDKWQINFSVHGNALFVPSSKQTKLLQDQDLQIIKIKDSDRELLPTVFGPDTDIIFEGQVTNPLSDDGEKIDFEFDAIDGLDKKVLAHPFAQLTVGLPYGTEVTVRYLPNVTVDDVGYSTYGVGLKHNFNQYIKYSKEEDFQFAAAIGYSNIKLDYAFAPVSIPSLLELKEIEVDANLWLAQVIGSKLYENFEVFGAAGITNSNFDYAFGGSGGSLTQLNSELGTLGDSEIKFKADLGFNLYFGKFKVSSMLTAGSFFNANLGVHYRIQ